MKKTLSVLCLFAMLLSLAAVMTVGTSAKTVDNSKYYGVYATTAPAIDGKIDKIWDDAIKMPFGNAEYGYIKVMWDGTTDEGTLYLLAVVNGCEEVDFVISTRFYNYYENNKSATWDWGGNFGIHVDADTDSAAEGYQNSTKAWTGLNTPSAIPAIKTKATETGFVAEIAFNLSNANAVGFKKGGFFGIGAFLNGDYTTAETAVGMDVEHITEGSYYIYALYMNKCSHSNTNPATCKTGKTCADCGKVLDNVLDPTKHAEEAIWVKTDDENHHKHYPCCGADEETNEPHEWDTERTVDKPATCTEKGEDSIHCKKCDARKDVGVLNALGHDFAEEYTTTKEPDCENDGSETRKCTRCDEGMDTRAIPKLGHDFAADYTVDEEPDCTNKGSKSKHCSRCDAKDDVQEVPALGHDFPEEFVVDVKPTCTKSGSESRHCTRCDETTDTREVPAAGHKWSDWTTVAAATCKKPGARHKTCTVCWVEGEVETVTVPHTAGEWIIDKEAAPGVAGKRHHVCTVCKAVFDEEEIPALPVADTDNKTTDTDSHPYAVIGCKGSLTATAGTVGVLLLPLALVVCGKRRKERESE